MKKNIPVILISLSISLFIFGCTEKLHVIQGERSHEHGDHGGEAAVSGLSLNNGERWEMDNHTRIISLKMEKTFFDADHSTQTSLNAVGAKLEAQLDELIAGCTMDGEAHNQLHTFLAGYIPTINDLAKAKDLDTARNSAIKLKGHLETYKKYFK